QILEARGARAAEVEDVPGERHVAGGKDALDDVVDPGVVAAGGAVAEEGERLSLEQLPRELVDGEVGALARAVDGEEAERGDLRLVQVVERVREDLGSHLARGVRALRRVDARGLLEGRRRAGTVDGRAASEDESLRAGLARGLEDAGGALDVDVHVR